MSAIRPFSADHQTPDQAMALAIGSFATAAKRIVARFYRRYPDANAYRWDDTSVKDRIYSGGGRRCAAVRRLGAA
jgi:hypothetical protein